MYNRPYTVQTISQKKEIELEKEEAKKNIGVYTTNDTRKEVAQEIKRSHFQFGSAKEAFPESMNKATYQNLNIEGNGISAQQQKMSKMSRKSNFILGTDQANLSQTTSNQAYNQK